MLVKINAAKCVGIDAVAVTIEVNCVVGIGIHLVGLADIAVKESLLRTTTALRSIGYRIPGKQIVINLAPADLHKSGSGYDLPIAVGIIAVIMKDADKLPGLGRFMIMGELGLDGSVRAIPGALPYAELAAAMGLDGIILPEESALEAVEFRDIKVFGVKRLQDVVSILQDPDGSGNLLIWDTQCYRKMSRQTMHEKGGNATAAEVDFADIIGQEAAKRGMEIAAAGAHNIILVGSPGSGKSSLAKALPGIMPKMTREEAVVTSKIYSIAGKGRQRYGLIRERPFRAPHYSASIAAIIGGGGGDNVSPGEVSLAQNGVLFLDEVGQMPRSTLDALRGPMEDRKVTISRLKSKVIYPADFMLAAASNPCPCGWWGDGDRCNCSPTQRRNYLGRLSGPILDRIDLQCIVRSITPEELAAGKKKGAESSAAVAERVLKARVVQKMRFAGENILTNSQMNNKQIEKYCPLSPACEETMIRIMEKMGLSMRAYFRIIRLSRTIADLDGERDILPRHLIEAAGYRFLDKVQ